MEEQNFFQRNMKWVVVVIVLGLLVVWGFGQYNSFISQNEAITGQWSQVENQYQRRFDLIPNLVNTVKGFASQEQTVFGQIAEARTKYSGARTADEKAAAATQVESALGRLLVITENYPQLQSSQNFKDLMVSLEGTENRISVERMKYNQLVQSYNTSVKRFPSALIAKLSGFGEHAYFNVPEANQQAPQVNF